MFFIKDGAPNIAKVDHLKRGKPTTPTEWEVEDRTLPLSPRDLSRDSSTLADAVLPRSLERFSIRLALSKFGHGEYAPTESLAAAADSTVATADGVGVGVGVRGGDSTAGAGTDATEAFVGQSLRGGGRGGAGAAGVEGTGGKVRREARGRSLARLSVGTMGENYDVENNRQTPFAGNDVSMFVVANAAKTAVLLCCWGVFRAPEACSRDRGWSTGFQLLTPRGSSGLNGWDESVCQDYYLNPQHPTRLWMTTGFAYWVGRTQPESLDSVPQVWRFCGTSIACCHGRVALVVGNVWRLVNSSRANSW